MDHQVMKIFVQRYSLRISKHHLKLLTYMLIKDIKTDFEEKVENTKVVLSSCPILIYSRKIFYLLPNSINKHVVPFPVFHCSCPAKVSWKNHFVSINYLISSQQLNIKHAYRKDIVK